MLQKKYQEIEVKFNLSDPEKFENTVQELGATQIQFKMHEYNIRFDTPTLSLIRENQVLRLRRDRTVRLTFKGPATAAFGVSSRKEIEFEVGDFDTAKLFIESLGYQASFIYEKYRATYKLDQFYITIDKLPFGDFCEIEGPTAEEIKEMAKRINLNWEMSITESYKQLFDRLKKINNVSFNDIIFENFIGVDVNLKELGIHPADKNK
jgi:adenylate cyclase, class 2